MILSWYVFHGLVSVFRCALSIISSFFRNPSPDVAAKLKNPLVPVLKGSILSILNKCSYERINVYPMFYNYHQFVEFSRTWTIFITKDQKLSSSYSQHWLTYLKGSSMCKGLEISSLFPSLCFSSEAHYCFYGNILGVSFAENTVQQVAYSDWQTWQLYSFTVLKDLLQCCSKLTIKMYENNLTFLLLVHQSSLLRAFKQRAQATHLLIVW